jgi:hypothetical protein
MRVYKVSQVLTNYVLVFIIWGIRISFYCYLDKLNFKRVKNMREENISQAHSHTPTGFISKQLPQKV